MARFKNDMTFQLIETNAGKSTFLWTNLIFSTSSLQCLSKLILYQLLLWENFPLPPLVALWQRGKNGSGYKNPFLFPVETL